VSSIGSLAFYGCSSLINVTIPSSVQSIGGYTFTGCSSLKSVFIEDCSKTYYYADDDTNMPSTFTDYTEIICVKQKPT
jgi:hypothetical protein